MVRREEKKATRRKDDHDVVDSIKLNFNSWELRSQRSAAPENNSNVITVVSLYFCLFCYLIDNLFLQFTCVYTAVCFV